MGSHEVPHLHRASKVMVLLVDTSPGTNSALMYSGNLCTLRKILGDAVSSQVLPHEHCNVYQRSETGS